MTHPTIDAEYTDWLFDEGPIWKIESGLACASLLGASMNHTMLIKHTRTTSVLRILHTRFTLHTPIPLRSCEFYTPHLHYTHPYHFDLANSTHHIYITHTHTTSILRILYTRFTLYTPIPLRSCKTVVYLTWIEYLSYNKIFKI